VEHLPARTLNRAGSLSVGVTVGSFVSGYKGGSAFGDFGLGLQTRYRPAEAFALELGAAHYSESFGPDTERARTSGSLSGVLYMLPWSKVSPYVLGGVTLTGVHRDTNLPLGLEPADGGAKSLHFGPHGGLGVEIALGDRFALDIDGRVVGYVTRGEDRISPPAAFTGNIGVTTFF
jgi:opacity protein-like surface antigen